MVPVAPPAVVVHIPHASRLVPSDVAAHLLLTPDELERELLLMTDHDTDALFALPSGLVTTITFPVSHDDSSSSVSVPCHSVTLPSPQFARP